MIHLQPSPVAWRSLRPGAVRPPPSAPPPPSAIQPCSCPPTAVPSRAAHYQTGRLHESRVVAPGPADAVQHSPGLFRGRRLPRVRRAAQRGRRGGTPRTDWVHEDAGTQEKGADTAALVPLFSFCRPPRGWLSGFAPPNLPPHQADGPSVVPFA